MPAGCSAAVSGGKIQVFWNEAKTAASCGTSGASLDVTAGIAPLVDSAMLEVHLDSTTSTATITLTGNATNCNYTSSAHHSLICKNVAELRRSCLQGLVLGSVLL